MKSLQECPIVYPQVVAWGDMDAFGHLNNINYYRYVEEARIHYMHHVGMFESGLICVVASNSCRYLASVEYPDTLKVGVTITEIRNSGFKMEYYLFSNAQQRIVATSDSVLVMMEQGAMQKAAMPQILRDKIIEVEARVGNDLTVQKSLASTATQTKEMLTDIGRTLSENIKDNIKENIKEIEQLLPLKRKG